MSLAVPATLHEVHGRELIASREGAAFRALVEALRRPHVNTVIIPTPEHFSRFGGMYREMRTAITVETGADIVIMSGGGVW